jgi:hypothetical protein
VTPEIARALKHGGDLHRRLEKALRDRLRMSERKFNARYGQMAQNEELFQAYIPAKEIDKINRLRRKGTDWEGVPDYSAIELPYAYSVVMTTHTYYSSVFCARNPVFQLQGRHGETEQQVQAMETLMAYQASIGMMMLPLFVWLLDPGKYGYSVVGHYWDEEMIRCRTVEDEELTFFGVPIPGAKPRKKLVVKDLPGYSGNRLYNVRPQDFFPDPRVALVHFQKGEFCGRYCETSWHEIYQDSRHANNKYRYFNYDILKVQKAHRDHAQVPQGVPRDEGSERVTTLPGAVVGEFEQFDLPIGFVKGHEIYLKLIPKEWKLGDGQEQEIWAFNLSASGVVFGAGPLGEYFGKFPFDILTDEIDGYTLFPKSTLERVQPLNQIMTWLVNSHFYNVRSVLNNMLVVDPSMAVMKDIENPNPGKLIRAKPQAYGRDIRTWLQQLQTSDVTRGHVADLQLVMDMVQRMVPANDSMMGLQQSQGNRTTATQSRISTHFGTSRLKTQCEWWSASGWSGMTQKLIQRTQQHYDIPTKLRLVGDVAQFSTEFLEVTPELISGFYDFEPVDGTLPVDRFAQANLWKELMVGMEKYPQILMTYDIAKIFAWVAKLGGIKNLAQFRLTDDQKLLQQAQAGNVVPIGEALKATGGPPKVRQNPNEPRQLPNMGATG